MPQPTLGMVHVDQPLTNISIAYQQSAGAFIAERVFPFIPVSKKTDKYYTYDRSFWYRDGMKRRAPGTPSAGSGYTLSTDSYSADVWALHKDIDHQTRANADNPINLDRESAQWLTLQGMIRKERQWTTDYFGTGVWTTDKVGGTDFTQWSDEAASDPVKDVEDGKALILQNTGMEANTLVVGYRVHQALKRHPLVLERFKYTSSESITEQMLAALFEVPRYFVAKGVYTTSVEGQSSTYDFIQGKNALLCHSAPNPGLMIPSAGYTFGWSGLTNINSLGIAITSFWMQEIKSDRIEIEVAFDMKKVAADLGYFFSSAVA